MVLSQDEQLTWGSHVNDEEVAESILAYLAEHPQAMDSVEGIAQWWIMRQQVRVNVTTLARVLQGLADKGLLEQIGDGEQRRYRLKG
jgi:DNA-binding IclR family transcriptional regulator